MIPDYDWLSTYPSGKAHVSGMDQGQTGWRLHAVPKTPAYGEIHDDNPGWKWRPALCGTKPGTGWGHDLFIEDQCVRCLKWLGKRGDKLAEEAVRLRKILSGSHHNDAALSSEPKEGK